jgi:hypothetical protein
MFAKFRKNLRISSRGLLTPNQAAVDIGKQMLTMMREQKHNPDPNAPYYLRIMSEDTEYYGHWNKRYFPKLDEALDKETAEAQKTALRLLVLESIDKLSAATWSLYESVKPEKERPDSDRMLLAKDLDSSATLGEFVDSCAFMALINEPSLNATLHIAMKYFGEDRTLYSDAYEMIRGHVHRLRTEKILNEAKGSKFTDEFILNFYEMMNGIVREQISEGHTVTVEGLQQKLDKAMPTVNLVNVSKQ